MATDHARDLPDLPTFRITLFYGPEPVEGSPTVQSCVFNVKKRSWKGGVQVAVELEEAQLLRARAALRFQDWLDERLTTATSDERAMYIRRAGELFVQHLAALKLDLAIEAGLRQENQHVDSRIFIVELDQRLLQSVDRIKSQILAELDLPEALA